MACCKVCCGCKECDEGEEGKCCCGLECCAPDTYCCNAECVEACSEGQEGDCKCGPYCCAQDEYCCDNQCVPVCEEGEGGCLCGGGCCPADQFCCDGVCQEEPCDETCCTAGGNCSYACPGSACYPTNTPGDDGCCCDSNCYTVCFDCCGPDASDCCTPSPVIESLWDTPPTPGLVRIALSSLERDMAEYGIDMDEAWGAAMQSGSGKEGYYVTQSYGLVSLAFCLQEISEGVAPWRAVVGHQQRVRSAASAVRGAA